MLPHLLRFPIGTLAKDTAGKLQELDIVNAADCKTGNRAFGIHRAQLYTYLPSFHGLRKLTLNFVWVSAEILLRVCLECHLLEFLGLELFPANQRSTLTAVHWAQARHVLPRLPGVRHCARSLGSRVTLSALPLPATHASIRRCGAH